jgi:hypothetical protein
LESLPGIEGFEYQTLRLNHTERQKVRKAQENKDDKPITSKLLQPQRGIYAIAQPLDMIGGGAGI